MDYVLSGMTTSWLIRGKKRCAMDAGAGEGPCPKPHTFSEVNTSYDWIHGSK